MAKRCRRPTKKVSRQKIGQKMESRRSVACALCRPSVWIPLLLSHLSRLWKRILRKIIGPLNANVVARIRSRAKSIQNLPNLKRTLLPLMQNPPSPTRKKETGRTWKCRKFYSTRLPLLWTSLSRIKCRTRFVLLSCLLKTFCLLILTSSTL